MWKKLQDGMILVWSQCQWTWISWTLWASAPQNVVVKATLQGTLYLHIDW